MSPWKWLLQSCRGRNVSWTLLNEAVSFWGLSYHRVLPVAPICSACFQEGLLGGIHHLPDPLHCAAHTAVGGPRREAFDLHCTCPREVGQYRCFPLIPFLYLRILLVNTFVILRCRPILFPQSFTEVQNRTGTAPARVQQESPLPSDISSLSTGIPHRLLDAVCFHLYIFYWWPFCFEWLLSIELKRFLLFLSTYGLSCALWSIR